ncbi:prolipoprotein diacylglyceryl transferase [Microaceticoccus formicicus]|uniref:prolipoprotein diacylglyceryl transferase n=1 Tax=Microaceticoccus formicicus TaxID=3118105 RepID=UPI003CD0470C|nr:prolipoprotein diacylglyceryl transferase [Peptoniphilaceae bacterium AMB_02]
MSPTVDRVAFTLFGIEIMWYAVLIGLGMLLGIYLAERDARRRGVNPDNLMDVLIWALPLSIVGARLYYVAFEWNQFKDNPIQILNIRGGGLAIYGGIIAAFLTAYIVCRIKKISFIEMADITVPSLALGQAIGRWGNFINQEAHGYQTDLPWAVIIDGVGYHPTFLYESIGDAIIFAFLFYFARKRQKYIGEISAIYLVLYGILRFFVEGLRTDSLYFIGFRVSQLVSIAGIILGVFLWFYSRNKLKLENKIKN